MSADFGSQLAIRREERITAVVRRLLDGVEARELRPEIEEIDAYSRLLSARPPKKEGRSWLLPAVVAVVCIVVAGILWSLKIPRTNISMTVDTDSVTATLAKQWRIDGAFHSKVMHFERVSKINAPNLGLAIDQSSGDAWFELDTSKGGQVDLQTLVVEKNGTVEISTDADEVDLYASKAQITGKITVTGKVKVTAGPRAGETTVDGTYDIDIPETVEFAVSKPQTVPSQLTVHQPAPWSLGRPQAASLSFVREELKGTGERQTISGIKSGTARFNDTNWPVLELREGDLLTMPNTSEAVLDAKGDKGLIHMTVNGAVSALRVGDSTTKTEIAPSYLEYLYNKKSLAFFWSAIVFLWGLIWSVRNTIFRQ
ncbi:MAG: hypothetical protein QOI58_3922 [Thermoanaerobaculia bacterium]|jgi:hypothetical protein|nr:hypothetical protein [Thermoanaerobaculia bacterium]